MSKESVENDSTIDFRQVVMECARAPEFVECFHRACGFKWQAAIESLVAENSMLQAAEEEQLACFIVFVHENIWTRLKAADKRIRRRPGHVLDAVRARMARVVAGEELTRNPG